jgi:cysteine desulfuration protein SufE
MSLETIEEIAESFALFDDWKERYEYLIDLGRRLPAFDEEKKIEKNLVQGCVSRVWLVADNTNVNFSFAADSDSEIVRGLIYLLMAAYAGKSPAEVASYDIDSVFAELGFDQHLSPNRRNGFFSMVERIRDLAGPA